MEEGDDDKEYPVWGRILIAVSMLGLGAMAGGLIGGSWLAALWGTVLASPIALLGFVAPAVLGWVMVVLELFSCVS